MLGNNIENIPDGWTIANVEDIADIKTGSGDTQDKEEGGKYPFFVRSRKIESVNHYTFDGEGVLTAGDGDVGKIFHYVNGKIHYHQRVYNIHNFKKVILGKYFYEYFSHNFYSRVKRLSAKGTVDSVRLDMIAKMSVLIPPVEEQAAITTILSSLSKKIDLVSKKIENTATLKAGLMQKLFSEGIGTKKEEQWEPHVDFYVSPIGKIPKSWQILTIDELGGIVEDGDRGKEYPKQGDLSDEGYCLFLNAKNVTKSGLDFTKLQFITESKDSKLRKGKVLKNDIVITTRGSVGHVGYFKDCDDYESVRINSGMAIIRTEYNSYLNVFMMSSLFKKQVNKMAFGSAQPQLTIKNIKNFKVAVPSSNEEIEKITTVILNMDDKLRLLYQQKLRLEELKKGLMQKLLTGKWRVNLRKVAEKVAIEV